MTSTARFTAHPSVTGGPRRSHAGAAIISVIFGAAALLAPAGPAHAQAGPDLSYCDRFSGAHSHVALVPVPDAPDMVDAVHCTGGIEVTPQPPNAPIAGFWVGAPNDSGATFEVVSVAPAADVTHPRAGFLAADWHRITGTWAGGVRLRVRTPARASVELTIWSVGAQNWGSAFGDNTGTATTTVTTGISGGAETPPPTQQPAQQPPPAQPVNRPPVAVPDHWVVAPGKVVDDTVLTNDSDPDGDPITPRVLSISYLASEWSGMDPDGGFLYTAGAGTRVRMVKRITYVVVDSHGARSAPVVSTITVQPRPRGRAMNFTRTSRRVKSTMAAVAVSRPSNWVWVCKGSGIGTKCYFLLSVATTRELNGATSWFNLATAYSACTRFGLLPLKPKQCATNLAKKSLGKVWDKSVVNNAARWNQCVLYVVSRKRTLRHPRAGEWSMPEYHPINSLTRPWDATRPNTSGWGYWSRGLRHPGKKLQLPVACLPNGLAAYRLDLAVFSA